jgi:hypothetical protein
MQEGEPSQIRNYTLLPELPYQRCLLRKISPAPDTKSSSESTTVPRSLVSYPSPFSLSIIFTNSLVGVSYATTDKSDIDDIHIISSWPGEQHAMWKTPTRIAYARENLQIESNNWGFQVDPKLISYSWTKLLLDKNAAVGEHDDPALYKMAGSGMLQLPAFRDAAGVCEDFLREVYAYVSKKLRQEMTALTFDTTPMECWITLPAIWSDEAKDATFNAAKRAGFGNRIGDEVFTIAEPEAAAIATLKRFSGPNALNAIKVRIYVQPTS